MDTIDASSDLKLALAYEFGPQTFISAIGGNPVMIVSGGGRNVYYPIGSIHSSQERTLTCVPEAPFVRRYQDCSDFGIVQTDNHGWFGVDAQARTTYQPGLQSVGSITSYDVRPDIIDICQPTTVLRMSADNVDTIRVDDLMIADAAYHTDSTLAVSSGCGIWLYNLRSKQLGQIGDAKDIGISACSSDLQRIRMHSFGSVVYAQWEVDPLYRYETGSWGLSPLFVNSQERYFAGTSYIGTRWLEVGTADAAMHPASVVLCDALGRTVLSVESLGTGHMQSVPYTIDIPDHVPNGLYYLSVRDERNTVRMLPVVIRR